MADVKDGTKQKSPAGRDSGSFIDDALEGSLLSAISHDLRTPLTSIKGYASMVLDYEEKMSPEARRDSMLAIINASDCLVDVIDQVIDISRLRAGTTELQRTGVNLRNLLSMAVVSAEARMPEYEIITVLKKLPPQLLIDERRVRQVIDNLLRNAMRSALPGGKIKLTAMTDEGEVIICVTGEDPQLPPGQDPCLGQDSQRKKRDGEDIRGVGLSILMSRTVVELHGGRLWMERSDSKNRFCFTLPNIK